MDINIPVTELLFPELTRGVNFVPETEVTWPHRRPVRFRCHASSGVSWGKYWDQETDKHNQWHHSTLTVSSIPPLLHSLSNLNCVVTNNKIHMGDNVDSWEHVWQVTWLYYLTLNMAFLTNCGGFPEMIYNPLQDSSYSLDVYCHNLPAAPPGARTVKSITVLEKSFSCKTEGIFSFLKYCPRFPHVLSSSKAMPSLLNGKYIPM